MKSIISGYEPSSLFTYFEQISAIPRGSGDEARIADFLCAWAEEKGIDCIRDEKNNVFMTAPATEGYEDRPAILLQGHTDMVCEKEASSPHDFTKDPLQLQLKNGILTAKDTTLGGDDGIAVAMMMAALTEPIPHPRLECLFTSDEERGMSGAMGFDYSRITATELINLDSEEEGVATVSCAGGARIRYAIPVSRCPIPAAPGLLSITLSDLSGGHSGAEIHLGKGNANELMARVLDAIYRKTPFQLISIDGGSKDNAITRDCRAVIYTCETDQVKETVSEWEKLLRAEAHKDDRRLRLRVKKQTESPIGALSFADTKAVLDAILLSPTGPLTTCPSDPSLVESSANLGVLCAETEQIVMTFLARSSVESRMDRLITMYDRLAARIGAEMSVHDRYPGWEYRAVSPLRDDFLRLAPRVLGEGITPRAAAIHAGLECGYILSGVDHEMDAISIGPDLKNIHTPSEALSLPSCERLWRIVALLLARH